MSLVGFYRWMLDLVQTERRLVRRFIATHLSGRLPPGAICLDVGAGTAPFAAAIGAAAPGVRLIRLDLAPRDGTDIAGDGHRLPFADGTLPMVASFQVIYAVEDPSKFIAETARVLTQGGLLLMTYQFLVAETRTRDLWRFSEAGMMRLLRASGFSIVSHERQGGLLLVLTELLAWLPARLLVVHRGPWQSGRGAADVVRLGLGFALGLPFHLLGFVAAGIDRLIGRQPWYIGGMVLARKAGDGGA